MSKSCTTNTLSILAIKSKVAVANLDTQTWLQTLEGNQRGSMLRVAPLWSFKQITHINTWQDTDECQQFKNTSRRTLKKYCFSTTLKLRVMDKNWSKLTKQQSTSFFSDLIRSTLVVRSFFETEAEPLRAKNECEAVRWAVLSLHRWECPPTFTVSEPGHRDTTHTFFDRLTLPQDTVIHICVGFIDSLSHTAPAVNTHLSGQLQSHVIICPEKYIGLLILSADISLFQICQYWCICSPLSADIKIVFLRLIKNAWTSDLKWCNHVVCPTEGGPLFNWY